MSKDRRLTDEQLVRLKQSRQSRFRVLATECLEARERGLMPTVDLASQLPTNRIPTNTKDGTFVVLPEGELSVNAWTPELDGKGKTTQVHLVMNVPNVAKFVHRMKSGPAVDQLIHILAEYRGEVWPDYKGVSVR